MAHRVGVSTREHSVSDNLYWVIFILNLIEYVLKIVDKNLVQIKQSLKLDLSTKFI